MVKLPEDMIIEILSILPVKSLIRFRCVSKSWYALVRSSSFISKHLKNDHNIHLILMFLLWPIIRTHDVVVLAFFDHPDCYYYAFLSFL
ncbi:hypothetical protein ACOSP7_004298 [Xanthoceras sorbifolium]